MNTPGRVDDSSGLHPFIPRPTRLPWVLVERLRWAALLLPSTSPLTSAAGACQQLVSWTTSPCLRTCVSTRQQGPGVAILWKSYEKNAADKGRPVKSLPAVWLDEPTWTLRPSPYSDITYLQRPLWVEIFPLLSSLSGQSLLDIFNSSLSFSASLPRSKTISPAPPDRHNEERR